MEVIAETQKMITRSNGHADSAFNLVLGLVLRLCPSKSSYFFRGK